MTNPKKLGQYEIVQEIGRGTLFVVYHAVDPTSPGRPIALQVLLPHLLVGPDLMARLAREVDKAAILRHPNIAAIYGVGEVEGRPFVAREFVDGQSLDQVLAAEGPLPLERALAIVEPVAAALTHAHARGLVHLDVTPSNILLGSTGRVVLTGFGLGKAVEEAVFIGLGLGTPAYMSPEQAAVEGPTPDWRADLYALGVIAYEMLTGRVPFQAGFRSAVLHQHVHELPPSPLAVNPALPPAVESVLLKALAKRPGDRYQSGAELAAALRETLGSTETAPRPVMEKPHLTPAPAVDHPSIPPRRPEPHVVFHERPTQAPVRRWLLVPVLGMALGLVVLVALCLAMLAEVRLTGRQPTSTWPTPTSLPTSTPYQGSLPSRITGQDGKEMVLVPAGEFLMGATYADTATRPNEEPPHMVYLGAYYIDEIEVTNAEFCRFLNEKGRLREDDIIWLDIDGEGCRIALIGTRYLPQSGYANHPVVNVTWYGARAYAQWAGKRLPTEAEWEKAARGAAGWIYPWGDDWDPARVSSSETGPKYGPGEPSPVGRYPGGASPYGCLDMAGNVWEWTSSLYDSYPYHADDGREDPTIFDTRVLRGGSCTDDRDLVRCAVRGQSTPGHSSRFSGFRCVVSPWSDRNHPG